MFRNYSTRSIISGVSSIKILLLEALSRSAVYLINSSCEILLMLACTLLLYANAVINNISG